MVVCAQCGCESPADFGFCPACGAALSDAPAAREVRKVVTVLFCDLTGSTAMGDQTDPEALRALMRRYYGNPAPIPRLLDELRSGDASRSDSSANTSSSSSSWATSASA